jgi:hypothetical protein
MSYKLKENAMVQVNRVWWIPCDQMAGELSHIENPSESDYRELAEEWADTKIEPTHSHVMVF